MDATRRDHIWLLVQPEPVLTTRYPYMAFLWSEVSSYKRGHLLLSTADNAGEPTESILAMCLVRIEKMTPYSAARVGRFRLGTEPL